MGTLGELRGRLRVVLGDASVGAYLWGDESLNAWLNEGVGTYGREFPREMVAELATVAGQGEYDLPAGCERVIGVYGPNPPAPLPDAGRGEALLDGGDSFGTGYRVFAGKLAVMPVPEVSGETVRVEYLGVHPALVADGDVSTVPEGDVELVVACAAGSAVAGLGVEDAKRGREVMGAGSAAEFMERFREGVRVRKRRVRVRRLVVGQEG